MPEYYYEKEGETVGPVTLEELKNQKLPEDNLVWREGIENWRRAMEFDELSEHLKKKPPPLPEDFVNCKDENSTKMAIQNEAAEELGKQKQARADMIGLGIVFILCNVGISYVIITIDLNPVDIGMVSLLSFVLRLASLYHVARTASILFKNAVRWGVFAFLLPGLAPLAIGLSNIKHPLEEQE